MQPLQPTAAPLRSWQTAPSTVLGALALAAARWQQTLHYSSPRGSNGESLRPCRWPGLPLLELLERPIIQPHGSLPRSYTLLPRHSPAHRPK